MRRHEIVVGALALIAAALAAAPAQAQVAAQTQAPLPTVQNGAAARQAGVQRFMDKFQAANTTHDGRLTLAQAQAGHMPVIVKNYAAIDEHRLGYVTIQDIRAWRMKERAARAQATQASAEPLPGPAAAPVHPYPTLPPVR